VLSCPECGLVLQTLDLPCPVCAQVDTSPLHDADLQTLHRFAKSFRTRHWLAPRPDGLIEKLNAWLSAEPGLVHVHPQLHRDHHDVVSGATVDCYASSLDPGYAFRFDRINLLQGKLGMGSRDAGAMLNDWAEHHPQRTQLGHTVFARNGRPTECWLVSRGPRDDPPPAPFKPPRVRLGVPLTLFLGVMLFVGILTSIIIVASATNTLGWIGFISWPAAGVGTVLVLRYLANRRRRKFGTTVPQ
jgi:hypothetical protein